MKAAVRCFGRWTVQRQLINYGFGVKKRSLSLVVWCTCGSYLFAALILGGWSLKSGPIADEEQWVKRFQQTFGIELSYRESPNYPSIKGEVARGEKEVALQAYTRLLFDELSKYDPQFLREVNIKTIYLLDNVHCGDRYESGVVPGSGDFIVYDFQQGTFDRSFAIRTIHHELFHYAMGTLYGNTSHHDSAWEADNKPGTTYGDGGMNATAAQTNRLTHPAPGFIDGYSESEEPEDMAEIYGCEHEDRCSATLSRWSAEDLYLAAKVRRLNEIINPEKDAYSPQWFPAQSTSEPVATLSETSPIPRRPQSPLTFAGR